MWRSIALIIILLSNLFGFAQTSEDKTERYNLKQAITNGSMSGHLRNYFMYTNHAADLPDYWTNAAGATIKMGTAKFKGFGVGVSGSIVSPIASPNLFHQSDAGFSAKWERELYDLNQTANDNDLNVARFEELYVTYESNGFNLKLGRQNIDAGPLLKKRDGRMLLFLYKGLWTEYRSSKSDSYLGFISGIAPRSISQWNSLNEGIGLFNEGNQPNGQKSDDHSYSKTKGLFIAGHKQYFDNHWSLSGWTYWLNRVFGLHWLEVEYEKEYLYGGFQYVFQHALPYQQKLSYKNRYYQTNENANIFALQMGLNISNFSIEGAISKNLRTGRFLYPKELGRDNFYTSVSRSRMDGLGAASVYKLELHYQPQINSKLNFGLSFQNVSPDKSEGFRFNKYGIPQYNQLALDIKYKYKNIDMRLLYIDRKKWINKNELFEEQFYLMGFNHINLVTNLCF